MTTHFDRFLACFIGGLVVCSLAACSDKPSPSGDGPLDSAAVDTGSADGGAADGRVADGRAADGRVADGGAAVSPESCKAWAPATETGTIEALTELSGMARNHNGWLWAHNDSGETKARIFLLDTTGRHRATLTLPGVQPVDWEDMASGPCGSAAGAQASGRCLWIGDIGDNSSKRSSVSIIRVLEPTKLPAAATTGQKPAQWLAPAGSVDITRFRYPSDGQTKATDLRPDAEALAALSDGRLLVATKRNDGRSRLYRVTPGTGTVVAVLLGTLNVSDPPLMDGLSLQVTAADLIGDDRLLVRTYFRAWVMDFTQLLTSPLSALKNSVSGASKQKVATGFDVQGEAIASDGAGGFWHSSEKLGRPLWHVICTQ